MESKTLKDIPKIHYDEERCIMYKRDVEAYEEELKQEVINWIKEARTCNNPFFFTTLKEGDTDLIRDVVETTLKKIHNITEEDLK